VSVRLILVWFSKLIGLIIFYFKKISSYNLIIQIIAAKSVIISKLGV